jgi:hypothetical protein
MKFSEATRAVLQKEFDQKLQNAVRAIEELQRTCVDNQDATNANPEAFNSLIDQLINLHPKAI